MFCCVLARHTASLGALGNTGVAFVFALLPHAALHRRLRPSFVWKHTRWIGLLLCYLMTSGFNSVYLRMLHAPCANRAKFQSPQGIIQRPLATIHKHLGTPAKVVCDGPLHRVKSAETPERCRTVRPPCVHRATTPPLRPTSATVCAITCYALFFLGTLLWAHDTIGFVPSDERIVFLGWKSDEVDAFRTWTPGCASTRAGRGPIRVQLQYLGERLAHSFHVGRNASCSLD